MIDPYAPNWVLIALTKDWMLTSLAPATTTAEPLALTNSFATNLIAVCALALVVPPESDCPVISLYNEINTAPSSEGLIAIRTSALDPVMERPDSNWIWRDILPFFNDL